MSELLERAVIDAKALRETAIKAAENKLLEKYHREIKEAVYHMLEADEDIFGSEEDTEGEFSQELGDAPPEEDLGLDDMGMDMPGEVMGLPGEDMSGLDVPLAATAGENMCSCTEEDEEIEINFDQLAQEIAAQPEEEDMQDDPEGFRAASDNMPDDREGFPDVADEEDDQLSEDLIDLDEELLEAFLSEYDKNILQEDDDEEDLYEELTVDVDEAKSGWLGTPDSQREENEVMRLANKRDTHRKEYDDRLKVARNDLYESLLREERLEEKLEEHKIVVSEMNKMISGTNRQNAILLYTNKVLKNASLNERQKHKYVEVISKAKTIDEAKHLYEALKDLSGTIVSNKTPKSINEAISKKNISLIMSKKRGPAIPKEKAALISRFQKLAGIKK